MSKQYLDKTGLSYFWGKIKAYVDAHGGNVDYIVEQGTNGIWTYRKWNSGVAECWGSATVALNINQSYGALYWATFDQALPSGLFTSVTSAVATRGATSGSQNGLVGISFHNVSTTTLGAYVYDSVAASDTWGLSFDVKGRWK